MEVDNYMCDKFYCEGACLKTRCAKLRAELPWILLLEDQRLEVLASFIIIDFTRMQLDVEFSACTKVTIFY